MPPLSQHVSNHKVQQITEQPLLISVIQKRHLMLFGHLARMDESADWCRENSYSSSPEWLEKADRTSSHLLAGHSEEWPIIPQPQHGRCHQAGTGQANLEVIGSKRSYALKLWWWWWWLMQGRVWLPVMHCRV